MKGTGEDSLIVRSPFADLGKDLDVPNIPYPHFLFDCLRMNKKVLEDRVALMDALRKQTIMYKDIEPMAIRFASALTKRGFQKGDVFFYITYNSALLFVLQLGVELCGGAIRGCFQREEPGEVERQMRETKTRFILCEPETEKLVKMAAGNLDWPVNYFSIDGNVNGASPVEEMAYKDDGSAYNREIAINPEEDIMFIPSTGGSTGIPKGVLHTHRNVVTMQVGIGAPFDLERVNWKIRTVLAVFGNFSVASTLAVQNALIFGDTLIIISIFDMDTYFKFFDHYKPSYIALYVYLANILIKSPELESREVSFVENILLGGSVSNPSMVNAVRKKFPHAKIDAMYGMTETLIISSNIYGQHYTVVMDPEKEALCQNKVLTIDGESYVSNGVLVSMVEAKIVDLDNGKALGRHAKGRLLVRSPLIMKGYLVPSEKQGIVSKRDENGWFDTGDLGFFDEDGHLYIIERINMIFKYFMHMVSPADVEEIILQHPCVQSVGVVGVPNPETTSAAWAYVVIKPGKSVTEEEIKQHVAENMPFYKHLHGGVVFMDKLPESRAGKIDRAALLRLSKTK
ncbi:4-coumarate--CoA ligase CCL1-like [Ischnura elegans]|uniref:4-coumarate--CoA ligase CCL1-like n=1 Tax=Ischnura elegans TaxID=197161 RepID=UPI001ED888FB|nr:4-coumarate--CoA ligase CCL1-like [Ischnura elegans]